MPHDPSRLLGADQPDPTKCVDVTCIGDIDRVLAKTGDKAPCRAPAGSPSEWALSMQDAAAIKAALCDAARAHAAASLASVAEDLIRAFARIDAARVSSPLAASVPRETS